MSDILDFLRELPRLGQIALAIGILTPLLVLYSYLNPPKPPPTPPPPKRLSVSGDVTVQERPPQRKR